MHEYQQNLVCNENCGRRGTDWDINPCELVRPACVNKKVAFSETKNNDIWI